MQHNIMQDKIGDSIGISHTDVGANAPTFMRISGRLPLTSYTCSSTSPCAIPGTELPSLKLVLLKSAPVGTNKTRFHSPLCNFGRI